MKLPLILIKRNMILGPTLTFFKNRFQESSTPDSDPAVNINKVR